MTHPGRAGASAGGLDGSLGQTHSHGRTRTCAGSGRDALRTGVSQWTNAVNTVDSTAFHQFCRAAFSLYAADREPLTGRKLRPVTYGSFCARLYLALSADTHASVGKRACCAQTLGLGFVSNSICNSPLPIPTILSTHTEFNYISRLKDGVIKIRPSYYRILARWSPFSGRVRPGGGQEGIHCRKFKSPMFVVASSALSQMLNTLD
jgi:hypothetical protein